MDYTSQKLLFKVKKLTRYTRLYGVSRTVAKVKGQYHVKRTFPVLPSTEDRNRPGRHVSIIGCGNFAYSAIGYYLKKNYGAVLRGVMDVDRNHAASLAKEYDADFWTDDAGRILDDARTDLVYIASNHASHAEYAIRALERGMAVHIEKPHVVTDDQLVRLCRTMRAHPGVVTLGFNRPYSRLGKLAKRYLDGESGSAMYNWFIAGHEIPPDHWYFHPEEGGRVLGNLCHWTDFLLQMVPPESRYPIQIIPARAAQSESDIAVNYVFGDGSIGAITFSAKGHTFEGVREKFSAHRGNVLLALDDFKELRADIVDKKKTTRHLFRDHGHEEAIRMPYELVRAKARSDAQTLDYVWQTGDLFLRTKEALDRHQVVTIADGRPRL